MTAMLVGSLKAFSPTYSGNTNTFWTEARFRRECIAGTNRELAALLAAGHIFRKKPQTMAEAAAHICETHDISFEDFLGPRKLKEFVIARKEFAVYSYETLNKSVVQIGRFMKRDHSTICNLLRLAGLPPKSTAYECRHGHPWNEVNTYLNPTTGKRRCKACRRDYQREWERSCRKPSS